MLDERIQHCSVTEANGRVSVMGTSFADEAEANAEAAVRDAAAGRRLTAEELHLGFGREVRKYDYTDETRPQSDTFDPIFDAPEAGDDNLFRSKLWKDGVKAAFDGARLTKEQQFKKWEREEDDIAERADAVAADKVNPECIAMRKWAKEFQRQIRFDPDAPLSLFDAAENLSIQAHTVGSSAVAFRRMSEAAVAQYQQVLAARRDRLAKQRENIIAAFDRSVGPTAYASDAVPPGYKVMRMRGVRGRVTYDVLDGQKVVHSWPESDVPDSIREAAGA